MHGCLMGDDTELRLVLSYGSHKPIGELPKVFKAMLLFPCLCVDSY